MTALWSASILCLLLLLHGAFGFFKAKLATERVLKVTRGQRVAVKCPSQSLSEDDLVTWETEEGELLGVGNEFLLGSVENSVNLVCRRRNFRTASMVSAVVHVRLNERSRSDVYLRRFDWSNISCVDHPKNGYVFEWVNAKNYQVSRENILRIQMVKETDFGFYLCRPFDNMGPLPIKEVYILEDTSSSSVFATARSSEVPWYGLKKLRLKVASGGIISALCLPDEHLSGVKVRWQTPGGSSLEGNRLMKRAKDRRDFGTYSCQAVSITGGRWRRLVVVQNEASMRSASVVQNDGAWGLWGKKTKKSTPLATPLIPTPSSRSRRVTLTTTLSSSTRQSKTTRPRRKKTVFITMAGVQLDINERDTRIVECPDPGPVGRHPGYSQTRVYWSRDNVVQSYESRLYLRRISGNIFGTFVCWRVYENDAGDMRRIEIPVTLAEMKVFTTTTRKPISTTINSKKAKKDTRKVYELAPRTMKVLKNENVMLVCPNDVSVIPSPFNSTLRSVRYTWRDQSRVIGYNNSIFVSTLKAKKIMKYSCQHDFHDKEGRLISLFQNYTLRSTSNQIELPVGERQNLETFRSTPIRLLCASYSKEGDSYEWIHPSGQPVGSAYLLERYVVSDSDFGEYKCTVWRADGTSQLRKVRVLEKFHKRRKTVKLRRFAWLELICMERPPTGATFEWVHPKRTVISYDNYLHRQLKETSDFGHYVCHAKTAQRSLPPVDVMVLEDPVSPYIRTTKAPTNLQPGTVRRQLGAWIALLCTRYPSSEMSFEWVHPNTSIIARQNKLRWRLTNESDFGHYVCHSYVKNVHLKTRHVNVLKVGRESPKPNRETVYVRRREIARFECVKNPQRNFIYEWIHPQGFVVSQENVLQIQPVKNSDFGHYVCKSISPSGPNPDRNIFVEEDLIQLLTSNPKTPEIIRVTQLENVNISCADNPPDGTFFEWKDERGFQRSTSNYLSLTVIGSQDLGKFSCLAVTPNGPLPLREVIFVIRPVGLKLTPESGILKACVGQASVSALCWIENRQKSPLWRDMSRNDTRVRTSILSGRRARLALFDVKASDDGRIFECFSRALQLTRRVTVKVESCESCVCRPSETQCLKNGNSPPRKKCVNVNWMCDGEDDCGNGFDERNCPYREISWRDGMCEGQTMRCPSSNKVIPKGFWCDGEVDCDRGEDELACQTPQIIVPSRVQRVEVRLGAAVSLDCIGIGVPPPKLIWRFNWDCLPPGVRSTCSCRKQENVYNTRCSLTAAKVTREQLGIFTCEAINSKGRAFAEDYHVVEL